MKYNFDQIIDRTGSNSIKTEAGDLLKQFGITDYVDDDTIYLWVADMDFQCPQPVLDAMRKRVDQQMFGYSSHNTSDDYNHALQGWFRRHHDWNIDQESIVFCPGTVKAVSVAIETYTEPGDGILIQRPVYGPFTSSIEGNNREVVINALIDSDGYYTIDFEDFEAKAKQANTKMFILCSPHNPIGRVWTPDELIRMAEICRANDVIFVADEIHGDLIRRGQTHYPVATLVDDPRIIAMTAINKTFNVAGLHCSNIIIEDEELRGKFKKAMGFSSPSPFAISALIAAYNEGEDWLQQVNAYIDDNFAFLDQFIKERMPQAKFLIPEGTYLGWIDFRGYGLSNEEVRERIYTKANVVLESGMMFGEEGEGYQRINVASPRPLLKEAMERIAAQFNPAN